jgi:GNAT superfamily N-acetyltransferase
MSAAQDPTIRRLAPADEAAWRPLWAACLAFYGTSRPAEQVALTFRRLTEGGTSPFRAFVAELGQRMVGIAHAIFHPTCWEPRATCYLQDLFTAPEARGAGVGRALIAAVHAEATREGADKVYWLTAENNYPGRTPYDRVATRTPFIVYRKAV